jgi:hypothetical protein
MGKAMILACYHHFPLSLFFDDYQKKSMLWNNHWNYHEIYTQRVQGSLSFSFHCTL